MTKRKKRNDALLDRLRDLKRQRAITVSRLEQNEKLTQNWPIVTFDSHGHRYKGVVIEGEGVWSEGRDLGRAILTLNSEICFLEQIRDQVRQKRAPLGLTDAMIARVKGHNPGASIETICKALDDARVPVPLPENFKSLGHTTWHSIWSDAKFRNRVKKRISTVPAAKTARS